MNSKSTEYDTEVAKQLQLLKEYDVKIHIPKRGSPYFTRK